MPTDLPDATPQWPPGSNGYVLVLLFGAILPVLPRIFGGLAMFRYLLPTRAVTGGR